MTAREKCSLLRQIRKEIAESNGIVYLSSECTQKGECEGSCHICDAEIRYLDLEIQRLVNEGKTISLSGLSLNTFELNLSPTNDIVFDTENDNADRIMSLTIEKLDLHVRVVNLLKQAGFRTVSDIIWYTNEYGIEGLKYIRCGGFHFSRLKRALKVLGVSLEYEWPIGELFIPSGVIDDYEIEGTLLKKYKGTATHVQIPYGITDIDWYDFNYNSSVEHIEELKLPPTLRRIGSFSRFKNLKNIHFPLYVDEWRDGTFSDQKKIEEIYLPEGIRELRNTFARCENLKRISFPSTIKYIDGFALCTSGTTGLEVSFRGDHPDFYVENNCIIQKSTQTLVRYVGGSCDSICIPKNIRNIGQGAFAQCQELKTVEIPYGVECIGEGALEWCKNLNIVTIPSTVKNIGSGLLSGPNIPQVVIDPKNRYYHVLDNYIIEIHTQKIIQVLDRNIKEAVIPEGIKEIGREAFTCCFSLEKVVLPNTIIAIRANAFSSCDQLKEIIFPNSLEIIESNAFLGDVNIDYIVIPTNVHTFGEGAFAVGYCGEKNVRIFCEYSIAELTALAQDWKCYGRVKIYTKGKWYYEGCKPIPYKRNTKKCEFMEDEDRNMAWPTSDAELENMDDEF